MARPPKNQRCALQMQKPFAHCPMVQNNFLSIRRGFLDYIQLVTPMLTFTSEAPTDRLVS
jgi:hypothetical protein